MSRRLFTLVGVIKTDGAKLTKENIHKIDKAARQTQRAITKLSKSVVSMGKNMTTALTLPMGLLGGAVVTAGAKFDKQMAKSTAIMKNLSKSMEKDLRKAALDTSTTVTASAENMAEGFFFLTSAGLDAKASILALPEVAHFAQAGQFDLARATDLLTDAQSALGLVTNDTAKTIENMVRVSDVLVSANTLANASVEQFSVSLTNKAGASLRLVNKSIEEGVAVLAAFADQGLKDSSAGEALAIVLRDLQKAAIENVRAFKDANIAVYDAGGKMRNMADIIKDLENDLEGMTDKEKKTELSMLGFQEKSIAATMALLGTSEKIRRYQTDLENAAFTTRKVSENQIKNLIDKLLILRNRIVAVAIKLNDSLSGVINDSVIPALVKLVSKLEALENWFSKLSPAMKKLIFDLTTFSVVLGPVLIAIGTLIGLYKYMIPLYLLLIKKQLVLNGAMAANPIGLVITALAALTVALIFLKRNWEGISEVIGNAWDKIKFETGQAVSFIKEQQIRLLGGFVLMAESILWMVPVVGDKIQVMREKLEELADTERNLREAKRSVREGTNLQIATMNDYRQAAIEATKWVENETKATDKNTDSKKGSAQAAKAQREQEGLLEVQIKKTAEATRKAVEAERMKQEAFSSFQDEWTKKYLDATQQRLEILKMEEKEALAKAKELGASVMEIETFYGMERTRIEREETNKRIEESKREAKEKVANITRYVNMFDSAMRDIGGILTAFQSNEITRIDQRKQLQIDAINASTRSEVDKARAIEAIEKSSDKKTRSLKRKQAMTEKGESLFSIGINTAVAITKALAMLGPIAGPIAATLIGIKGAAMAAAVLAKPLPLFKGGLIKGGFGGVVGLIGEGRQDELVLPLRSGIAKLTSSFINKLQEMGGMVIPQQSVVNSPSSSVAYNVNIGTLIGDDRSLLQLERRLRVHRIDENQREDG